MKLQRARFRIIALLLLCAFVFVLVLSARMVSRLSDTPGSSEAGNEAMGEEYVEQTEPDESPAETAEPSPVTVPPAESQDTFGL